MGTENLFLTGLGRHFSGEQLERLQRVCVGIAGAGGLGSNCAAHLVRSGIGNLVLADFDVVEPSNLNRQFFFLHQVGQKKVTALAQNLSQINPDLSLKVREGRLNEKNVLGVFESCDIVVEALDGAEDKKMMAEMFFSGPRLLVSASGVGGWGNSDRIATRKIGASLVLVGDGHSAVTDTVPPTAGIIGVAAAKQADAVVEHILRGSRDGRISRTDLSP